MSADIHTPYVLALVARGDWAALVRYWIAHQHPPALDEAISIIRKRAEAASAGWPQLAKLLEALSANPLDRGLQSNSDFVASLNEADKATLAIVRLNPNAAQCELITRIFDESHRQKLEEGIRAAEEAALLSASLSDRPLTGFFKAVLAHGWRHLGNKKNAGARI